MGKTLKNLLTVLRHFRKDHELLYSLIGASIVFIVFFAVAYGRLDPDFGWHLVTGNYILAHGIPRHDTYTYTAKGFPWVDHEWGSDLLLALLYKAGGYLLCAIVFALIWSAALLILGFGSRILVLYIAALSLTPYAGIRTLAWTTLLFALSLRILRSSNRRWLWFLPLIFILWANLHAGFIAGLALIAYFAVIKKNIQLLGLLAICGAVVLINPYGAGLYVEVAHTIFDPSIHSEINEWRAFFINQPTVPYLILWFIGFVWVVKNRWEKWIDLGPLLLAAGLSASRNIPLFVVATVKDLDNYALESSRRLSKLLGRLSSYAALLIYGSLAVILLFVSLSVWIPLRNRLYDFPVQAVSYLKANGCSGHLFNSYDYGGYLIWQLPQEPVYIDGRMVTWTKYMNQYESVVNNPAINYPIQFAKYSINCALVEQSTQDAPLISRLQANGWHDAVQGNGSILLLRPSSPH